MLMLNFFNSYILYCLAKQAKTLGANKLAKQLLDRIQPLKVPFKFQEQVEIQTIAARARSYSDPEELLPMCYRCSTYNPLSATSNKCINCGQKFVHSYVSFGNSFVWYFSLLNLLRLRSFAEILPLVEFQLEDGITDMEAVRLIETPASKKNADKSDNWRQEVTESHQTLQLDFMDGEEEDPFTAKLINFDVSVLFAFQID